ncbi:monovalent cation/H+ antiporter complex subunit F [Corynebacterium falsenii]|uniref:Cation:proton antiporter n=1 Tax=Corynebacterium falsenii TaxID=108486 RepID=A0A418Q967_9CORY|nr:monovalent cation/H+ antiporter complex subunit F [Corynebacterium falsenii]AHI04060.1 cation:proton antiporter [Corynebacterium falsenii DSM 44353]MDC7104055.1 monovalent cation/H+ antiporter complex subunit F [Corynebacterium falsenii]RIX36282.1 cation:proton antiporter [Corynebacterium falsenii]UBI04845.1 cation:proton antiporter [Corynebacterium falsenii]UBI07177.1 cation:proton antiporter [Corynebacterium falsenii]
MEPTDLLTIMVCIAGAIVLLALITVLWHASTTDNDARRAVTADIVFMAMAGLFLCYTLLNRSSITYEVAMFAGLFGVLSTVAYARIITRGRR